MSPMIDLQRRHAEIFRIRLGEKGSRGEPRKLTDQVRITSAHPGVCAAFHDAYPGGPGPQKWQGEYEVYLPTDHLRVLMLPGQSIQQWWEHYKGSVCERRCDGVTEVKSGNACVCPADIDERMRKPGACRPMTRINVICPDVAVVGSGALVTHSLIAAETLPQSVAVAEAALSRGLMVPAVLRIVEHKGRNHFIVPQLEIVGVSLNELATGEVSAPALHVVTDPPELPERAATFTPVPAALEGPKATIAEQVSAPAKPARKTTKSVPATGRRPRTAAQVAGGGNEPAVEGEDPQNPQPELLTVDELAAFTHRIGMFDPDHRSMCAKAMNEARVTLKTTPPRSQIPTIEKILSAIETQQKEAWDARRRKAFGALAPLELDDDARHQFVDDATGGQTQSLGQLTEEQLRMVLEAAS